MRSPDTVEHRQVLGDRIPLALRALPHVADFYTGIFRGKFNRLNPQQVSTLTSAFLPAKPLLPLTQERVGELRVDIADTVGYFFSSRMWKSLAGNVYFFNNQSPEDLERIKANTIREEFLLQDQAYLIHQELIKPDTTLRPLGSFDKEALFTNPEFWLNTEIKHISLMHTTEPLLSNGTRSIEEYIVSYPEGNRQKLIGEIRERTGRQKLYVLDMGGSTGYAASELEKEDPNIDVTNLTIHPEPGLFPLRGGHIFNAAEMLPADFAESFDLVISNVAFTHMKYPHLALVNAIMATSIGGALDLSFQWDGHHFSMGTPDEEKRKQAKMLGKEIPLVFQWLQELAQEGIIEFRPENQIKDYPSEWGNLMHGRFAANKNGSITQRHLERLSELLSDAVGVN